MKKVVRQQNYLKALIETQANRFLTKQALKCLIRSAVEPLLDAPEVGVVLHRIENKDGLQGLLKRLEFSEVESHSFADKSQNIKEKVWANTEFLCVMTHRYVSIIIWDSNTNDKDFVRYYTLYNSKLQHEFLDILSRNSNIDISAYKEKFNPDRRDNNLLNASIRRLLDNMDEATNDAVLGFAEHSAEVLVDSDYVQKKSRMVAHEIKNQLSICDLYTEIINKNLDKELNIESIKTSLSSINKAIKMANNSLISLKTKEESVLKEYSLKETIATSIELSKVYLEAKNIELQVENNYDEIVKIDYDKLIGTIINLIKNASEAFPIEETDDNDFKNGKYIKIKTDKVDNTIEISISNNAPGISNPEKIFNEGFTSKSTGTGMGLWICKKNVESFSGELQLTRSTEDYTEFTISLKAGG